MPRTRTFRNTGSLREVFQILVRHFAARRDAFSAFRGADSDFATWVKCEAYLAFAQALATPPCNYRQVHRKVHGADLFLGYGDEAIPAVDAEGIWLQIEAFASDAEVQRVQATAQRTAAVLASRAKAWKGVVVVGVPGVWMPLRKPSDFHHDLMAPGAAPGVAPVAALAFWNLD